ncbi:hypothetical protein Bbelb_283190 [Branchiostoma belcheri]|nr:hypothetical protein Bbelb_283190 [Branchiostoma belcheri]
MVDQNFYNNGSSWGRNEFMPWHEVCDPQKGYIKDYKIILEAYVKEGVNIHKRVVNHVFYKNDGDWGYPKFIPWHEVCDPQKGYIKDYKIILEAYVKEGINIHKRVVNHVFYKNDGDWGYPKFIPWHEVCDPQKGYIKDYKIILEAYVKEGVNIHKRVVNHVFYKNDGDWGYPKFIPWHEVCDPQKGYIKDYKIILEAYVKEGIH